MDDFKKWEPNVQHPETPDTVFANVWEYDRVRRILSGRCRICDFVVSSDEKAVRELLFECEDKYHVCHTIGGSKAHQVCDVCYYMFRALYANHLLQSMNYFRQLDDKELAERNDKNRKDRLGL